MKKEEDRRIRRRKEKEDDDEEAREGLGRGGPERSAVCGSPSTRQHSKSTLTKKYKIHLQSATWDTYTYPFYTRTNRHTHAQHAYAHIRTHTHTYAHTHTHTHTHTHARSLAQLDKARASLSTSKMHFPSLMYVVFATVVLSLAVSVSGSVSGQGATQWLLTTHSEVASEPTTRQTPQNKVSSHII